MLMFKNSERMVPMGVRMLFARNDQYYNYNTRQNRSLHPSVGRGEAIYRSFSFGRRPDKIDLQSRNLILCKIHFYKKTQKLIKKILLWKTLKNIVILHILD